MRVISWLDAEHFLQEKDRKSWKVHARTGKCEPYIDTKKLAESLAGESAANLNVIHVLEPVSVFEPVAVAVDGLPVSGEQRRAARHRLEELVRPDTRAFADVGETVAAGKPYRGILRAATEHQSDLIVLGVPGRHLAGFGSTTTHVVREAACPVLTVRG